jgi:hypothetical protein
MSLLFKVSDASLQRLNKSARFVFARRCNNEVFRPVVVSDSVDMMNDFATSQATPKNAFHHQSMFADLLAHASIDINVSFSNNVTPATPPAMLCSARGNVVLSASHWHAGSSQSGSDSICCYAYRAGDSRACLARAIHCHEAFDGREPEPAAPVPSFHASPLESLPNGALTHAEAFGDLVTGKAGCVHRCNFARRHARPLNANSCFITHTRDCITATVN